MTLQEVQHYLNSFIDYEQTLPRQFNKEIKLERIQKLLVALGNPQQDLKVIHIAGTKGKGSTAVMIAHILKAAAYKVGLYTSPHINQVNERIRLMDSRQPNASTGIFADSITDDQLATIIKSIRDIIEQFRYDQHLGRLTFYEVFTAIAIYHFKQEQADFVVLETGLGGRLDATNTVDSLLAVITPISLEHMHILGKTTAQIAQEKAAIIKRQQDVIIAPQEADAKEVLFERCRRFDITPVDLSNDCWQADNIVMDLDRQKFNLQVNNENYEEIELSLLGRHQIINAAVAIAAVQRIHEMGYTVTKKDIHEGLANVYWPIRFEIIQKNPVIILDAAHNTASVVRLTETLKEFFPQKSVYLIFGTSTDKKISDMCACFTQIVKKVFLTESKHPRRYTFSADEAQNLFPEIEVQLTRSVDEAIEQVFHECNEDDIMVVAGSIFVASEARRILKAGRASELKKA